MYCFYHAGLYGIANRWTSSIFYFKSPIHKKKWAQYHNLSTDLLCMSQTAYYSSASQGKTADLYGSLVVCGGGSMGTHSCRWYKCANISSFFAIEGLQIYKQMDFILDLYKSNIRHWLATSPMQPKNSGKEEICHIQKSILATILLALQLKK